jgi:hypothetical protein
MSLWAATALIFSFNAAVLAYSMLVMIRTVALARILSSLFVVISVICLLGAAFSVSSALTG